MSHARTVAICAVGVVCVAYGLEGQGLLQYRNFTLGSSLAAVSGLADVDPARAKTMHQRPAVMQDLEWRLPRWIPGSADVSTDPVERMLFSFYNDQLFRVVVDYHRERIEGMTSADMIESMTASYGAPISLPTGRTASRIEVESGTPFARWGNAEHAVVLYQTSSYGAPFRLIVTDTRLDDLARQAEAQAVRLDRQEAPIREIAQQKKESDERRAAAEKARVANKGVFRP